MNKLLMLMLMAGSALPAQERQKTTAGCPAPLSYSFLNINNISTQIMGGGDMNSDLFGSTQPNYQFPKGSHMPAAGPARIWIGGFDKGGQLKIAAQTYRQYGVDFWAGPLNDLDASTDYMQCNTYDRIWNVSYKDINNFIAAYNRGDAQDGTYKIPESILNWPVYDDVVYPPQKLASFVDVNGDGRYNPKADGDYPAIRGDQSLYFIFNDNGGVHSSTGGKAVGLQINATVYAYGCPEVTKEREELKNTTFYHYKIYNRSKDSMTQAYIAVWVDATIGDRNDDYVGSNPKKGYMYAYNGKNTDDIYGGILPATGTVILKAPKAPANDGKDNDYDGQTDEPGEELLVPQMYYYLHNDSWNPGTQPQLNDPVNASQFYSYMTGHWRNGDPFTCGGNGFGAGQWVVNHVFPGTNSIEPNCQNNWTEKTANNIPGDRCYLMSMGPFTFKGHDSTEVEFAFVTSVDSNSVGNTNGSVLRLEADIDKVKALYRSGRSGDCLSRINYVPKPVIADAILVSPSPTDGILNISSATFGIKKPAFVIIDLLGREVFKNQIQDKTNSYTISSLAAGIYYVVIEHEGVTHRIKIVKS